MRLHNGATGARAAPLQFFRPVKAPGPPAIAVVSANGKVGAAVVTHASQASCPDSCPFKGTPEEPGPCYAEHGPQAWTTRRLNRSTETDPEAIAREEAAAIDRVRFKGTDTPNRPGGNPRPGTPMRIHIVGDATTDGAARILSDAAERYRARGGGPVWGYTHAWREVSRAAWGAVSILASVETGADALLAESRGYAIAHVAPAHGTPIAPGIRPIGCPAQVRKSVSCVSCGLCFRDVHLRDRRLAIQFQPDGRKGVAHETVKAALALAGA